MDIMLETNKKEYFKCSMYLMKKYFGVREAILLVILFIAAILLYVLAKNIVVLILFGITCALLLFTLVLFLWTSISGYKVDVERRKIACIKLHFEEKQMLATSYTKGGDPIFTETHYYEKLENIVFKRNLIYIYAGVAVFYYIDKHILGDEKTAELTDFLQTNVPEEKFKFRKRIRTYPKKKKSKENSENK